MKTNEAIYRSPKWLRNFLDYEVATGKDIKGEPSKRTKERMARDKAELQSKLFDELMGSVMNYLELNYASIVTDVYVIPKSEDVVVEFGFRTPKFDNVDATIIYYTGYDRPTFDVEFKCEKKYRDINYFNYRISGSLYAVLTSTIHEIVKWWSKKGRGFDRRNKGSKSTDDYYYGGGNQKKEEPRTRRAERPNQQTERDPRANRLRRLALLRQTLEGYEATLARTKKGTREYETLSNEIETIKGRIRAMERNNEGFNHVMSFQVFEKQFTPNRGDYVTIVYALTGEPVPVKIEKVYPNNTYLVSFNVEGSTAKGAPNQTIKNSDIVAPYKPIRSPVGTGYISANTNMSIRQVHQVSNDMYL